VDLTQRAEKWGYQRYWLAEHHSISGLASATPVHLTDTPEAF
jgi:alkanesulfonate monooxygenase SsuD/methylene tetrahydromethanopterin reductase-like flavin-dependent oxidoreductase (luciferase family)